VPPRSSGRLEGEFDAALRIGFGFATGSDMLSQPAPLMRLPITRVQLSL
jgi:hypothetical protein